MTTADPLGTIIDDRTIRFERLLPAPASRVWTYLTDSAALAGWLADADIEPRVGGRVEVRFEPDDVVHGEVTRFEPHRVIECTWVGGCDGQVDSLVRFELEDRGDQSLLTLTHTQLTRGTMPNFGAGWHRHLMALLARLRGEDRPPASPSYEELRPEYARMVEQSLATFRARLM